jgi:hypothetical protein
MPKFKVTLERTLTFEREYTISAQSEDAAIEAAWERDDQVDLISGKWTNEFRKSSAEEIECAKLARAGMPRKSMVTTPNIRRRRSARKKTATV